jgi:hypothetical protein
MGLRQVYVHIDDVALTFSTDSLSVWNTFIRCFSIAARGGAGLAARISI